MANSLLVYDFVLKPATTFRFEICDKFIQGTFVPKNNEVPNKFFTNFRLFSVQTH